MKTNKRCNNNRNNNDNNDENSYSKNNNDNKKKKSFYKKNNNMKRLGGPGLSLETFANAKSRNDAYNPALLKKKREFYQNAKHVNKYKKMVKQQYQHDGPSSSLPTQPTEENEAAGTLDTSNKWKKKDKGSYSLEKLYETKREEEERARMERKNMIKAKKEVQERAEARRKDLREKMFKKTRKGQPVMKYRIEHILETLQGSNA